jgi:acyl-CoA synthetase (AMP-forming)/AMP-acid ligase II
MTVERADAEPGNSPGEVTPSFHAAGYERERIAMGALSGVAVQPREGNMITGALRVALWAAASFNLGAAVFFAFASSLGHLIGLPLPVPRVYGVFVAMFVLLFAGAYAWMARTPRIDRPMLTLATIGKAAAVVLAVAFFRLGDVGPRALVAASGDLLLAVIFARWLWVERARKGA